MTDGNINGLHSKPGAQGYPYSLPSVHHFSIATGLGTWLLMLTT